jgi:hypothetical protein
MIRASTTRVPFVLASRPSFEQILRDEPGEENLQSTMRTNFRKSENVAFLIARRQRFKPAISPAAQGKQSIQAISEATFGQAQCAAKRSLLRVRSAR